MWVSSGKQITIGLFPGLVMTIPVAVSSKSKSSIRHHFHCISNYPFYKYLILMHVLGKKDSSI